MNKAAARRSDRTSDHQSGHREYTTEAYKYAPGAYSHQGPFCGKAGQHLPGTTQRLNEEANLRGFTPGG